MFQPTLYYISAFPRTPDAKRFKEEAFKLGLEFIILEESGLSLRGEAGGERLYYRDQPVELNQASMVIIRHFRPLGVRAFHFFPELVQFFNYNQVPLLNSDSFDTYPLLGDKLFQSQLFASHNLPVILPYYAFTNNQEALKTLKPRLPLLKKPRGGALGRGVGQINTAQELEVVLAKEKVYELLFQPFIPNDYDLRVIATPDKVIGAMKRSRTSGIVNNYSQGGTIEKFTLNDSSLETLCQLICKLCRADYLGIDLIFNKEEQRYQLLEVNRFVGFEGFEKVMGVNVARLLIEILLNKAVNVPIKISPTVF